METLPDFCIICGDVCQNDPDYCDKHLSDKRDELQVEINFQLDDLGDYITAL